MPLEATTDRLRRILVLVPWLMAHPGTMVEEVCERFGITARGLSADLDMLFMCGLPPFGPGDLIEVSIEDGRVSIRMADFLARPPRLTRAEALGLLIAGRALLSVPGLDQGPSLRSALDKLATAMRPGEADGALALADRVAVELDVPGSDLLATLRDAVADRSVLTMTYYVDSRAELTSREVEPLLVFNANGNWYIVARDRGIGEERTFRVDRIRDLTVEAETFAAPEGFDPSRYANGPVFTPSVRDIEVVLSLGAAAAWVSETIAASSVRAPDGTIEVRLRTSHTAWLVRLLLSAGPDAVVVSPAQVADEVKDAAARALAMYGSG